MNIKRVLISVIVLGIVCSGLITTSTGDSTEAGTGSATVNISNNSSMSGNWGAALVIDGGGNLHVVWEDDTPGNYDIMYATKPVSGSWSIPINISSTPGWSYAPEIAIDSSGSIHVVWGDKSPEPSNGILYVTKTVGGPWTPPVSISSGLWPSIAVDGYDTIHVVWQRSIPWTGNNDIWYASKPISDIWSMPVNISNRPEIWEQTPQIEVDTGGRLHVVWSASDGWRGFYATRPYGGAWSMPVSIDFQYGKTAIDNDDTLHVVWVDDGEILYAIKPVVGPWSAPENISNTPNWSDSPAIIIDSNSSIHVAWCELDAPFHPGVADIFYITKTNSWSSPINISNNTGTSINPDVACDSEGNLHVVWSDDTPGNLEVLYSIIYAPLWTNIFEDPWRGTKLFINTNENTLQFTSPDGFDSGVVESALQVYGSHIAGHVHIQKDNEIVVIYFDADINKDYCNGKVKVVRETPPSYGQYYPLIKRYYILDPRGFE